MSARKQALPTQPGAAKPDLRDEVLIQNELVTQKLRDQLLALDPQCFERFIGKLLVAMGYADVQVTDHTSDGGLDVQAYTKTGITQAMIIAQVKKYAYTVHRRFVDELRGTMLRVGAQQGLLITTSTFSEGAKDAAQTNNVAPVSLIDGDQLIDLLVNHQMGIRCHPVEHWSLDKDFFDRITNETQQASGLRLKWDEEWR